MVIVSLCIAAVCALLLYRANSRLVLTRYEVSLVELPNEFDGFTIVQVSDLHDKRFGPGQQRLIGRVRQADPDLCVMTGDMVGSKHRPPYSSLALIEAVSESTPVLVVTGNHELHHHRFEEVMGAIEKAGAVWVRDVETIDREGASLPLYGVDDPVFFGKHITHAAPLFKQELRSRAREHRRRRGPTCPLILLSHRPEYARSYAENGFDLVLSGHVHGGVWRLPNGRGLFAPDRQLLPRYSAGRYDIGSTTLIVSRGLGPATIPLRINNPPEVVVVVLRRADRAAGEAEAQTDPPAGDG